MKNKKIKETYFVGIPKCNNEKLCTIEFHSNTLILTIIDAHPPKSFMEALIGKVSYNEILNIKKTDIIGLEFGDGKPSSDAQSAAGCAGCLTFGLFGGLMAREAAKSMQDYPLKLSVKYNGLPIDIRFKPSMTMRYTYQEILTFWHS